ncbi:MAG: hypothetical protein V9E94_19270, partial [Microthrixaceae bacterium]
MTSRMSGWVVVWASTVIAPRLPLRAWRTRTTGAGIGASCSRVDLPDHATAGSGAPNSVIAPVVSSAASVMTAPSVVVETFTDLSVGFHVYSTRGMVSRPLGVPPALKGNMLATWTLCSTIHWAQRSSGLRSVRRPPVVVDVPVAEVVDESVAGADLVARGAADDVVDGDVDGVDRGERLECVELEGVTVGPGRERVGGPVVGEAVELAVQDGDDEVAVPARRLEVRRSGMRCPH